MSTAAIIAICITCLCAVAAVWDAARRYIEMRRYNQQILDHQARIDQEHEALKTQVKALQDKLAMQGAGSISRLASRVRP